MTKRQLKAHFTRFLVFYLIGTGVILLTVAIAVPFFPRIDNYFFINEQVQREFNENKYDSDRLIWLICFFSGMTIGIIMLIMGFVFAYILHYNNWKTAYRDGVRTTPGKAIGYLFIPFYNFYWVFVSFRGLAEEINKKIAEDNIPNPREANVGLATAFCIMMILCYIPFVNFLAAPAAQILMIVMLSNQKNAALQFIKDKE